MKNWKKRNKTSLARLIILLIFGVACTETEIPIELPTPKPKLVVHSAFTSFTPPAVKSFAVFVSRNAEVFDTLKIDQIPDATVRLFINGQFNQIMKYDAVYGYRANFFPTVGVEYSISVEKEGFETVTAKGSIPSKVLIKDYNLISYAGLDVDKNPLSLISVTFDDPADQKNFYEILILRDQNEMNMSKLYSSDPVITSEGYYPSLVAFDAKQPDRLLFSDKLINGRMHKFDITYRAPLSIIGGVRYINPHLIFLLLRNVSEDYYHYYTTLLKQRNALRPEILFGVAEPSTIFSNIQNGYGVFAGYSEDNRTIQVDSIRIR